MENLPRTVFSSILHYASKDTTLLKKIVSWERVSTRLSKRLVNDFWPTVQNTDVQFFGVPIRPFPMRIASEIYESLDLTVLRCFKDRGMRRIRIVFGNNTYYNHFLPLGFAASVPEPVSVQVGLSHNMNDPELIALLQMYCDILEGFSFCDTNQTLKDYFVKAFLNFKSLKQITLHSWPIQFMGIPELKICPENRRNLYKNLSQLHLKCLVIVSTGYPGLRSNYDEELFTLLEETQTIKCLHITYLNRYVKRWLTNTALRNRAQITNLCISNDQFGYISKLQNKDYPLFHTTAYYQLLFPRLKYLCIGICLVELDEIKLESILMCYFLNNSSNIQLHLTVRFFHRLRETPFEKLDRVITKLQSLQAEIDIVRKNKRDGIIKIKSKNGRISSEIIICFDKKGITRKIMGCIVLPDTEKQKCIDSNHCGSYSVDCLCVVNRAAHFIQN